MTPLDALYVVVAIVVAAVGGAAALLLWQVVTLLRTLETEILPEVRAMLTQAHQTMEQVDGITRDVNDKLSRLDPTLDEAQVTLHAIVEAGTFVSEGIVRPALINIEAFKTGTQAAWRRFQELRAAGKRQLAGPAEPVLERAEPVGETAEPVVDGAEPVAERAR